MDQASQDKYRRLNCAKPSLKQLRSGGSIIPTADCNDRNQSAVSARLIFADRLLSFKNTNNERRKSEYIMAEAATVRVLKRCVSVAQASPDQHRDFKVPA